MCAPKPSLSPRPRKKQVKRRFNPQWKVGCPWLHFENGVMSCLACRAYPQMNRDTRLSRYKSVCIPCHCVNVSMCLRPTFHRCDPTESQDHRRKQCRTRNRDTRLSRYDIMCILCHYVTVSLCHSPPPTVSCVGTFMKPSLPPVWIHVSHGYCVTVSLSTVRRCLQFKS